MKPEAFKAKTLRIFHSLTGKTGAEVQAGQGTAVKQVSTGAWARMERSR